VKETKGATDKGEVHQQIFQWTQAWCSTNYNNKVLSMCASVKNWIANCM